MGDLFCIIETIAVKMGLFGEQNVTNHMRGLVLPFRHRASCILGQAFHYSPENAFYIFNRQIYFIS